MRINAVSVVNLVMAVGLAVEFVIHVATAFLAPPVLPPQQSPPSPSVAEGGGGRRLFLRLPRSEPGKEARAKAALSSIGASVFSVRTHTSDSIHRPNLTPPFPPTRTPTRLDPDLQGITLTKLVGIAVLAVAPSHLFRIYYFRLYLALVLLGAFVGLAALPVLLSFYGPPARSAAPTRTYRLDGVHDDGEDGRRGRGGLSRRRRRKEGVAETALLLSKDD